VRRAAAAILVLTALATPVDALAAVSSSVVGGRLDARSDGADAIDVTCQGGFVKVNGLDPDTGPALCAGISIVFLFGGSGPNMLDVSGVTQASFGSYVPCYLFGDAGADTLVGSEVFNHFDGGLGSDTITGGPGTDALQFFGTGGNDTIDASNGFQIKNGMLETDTYSGIEILELWSADGNDTVTGSGGIDELTAEKATTRSTAAQESTPCTSSAPPDRTRSPPPQAAGP